MGDINFEWRWPFQMPRKRSNYLGDWLNEAIDEEEWKMMIMINLKHILQEVNVKNGILLD